MKAASILLGLMCLFGCNDRIDLEKGTDKSLLNRKWLLVDVTPASHAFYTQDIPYIRFDENSQITSNFLSNCYSYRVRQEGQIVGTNNCIDCTCPSGGCTNGLDCNQEIWSYRFLTGNLEIDFGGDRKSVV